MTSYSQAPGSMGCEGVLPSMVDPQSLPMLMSMQQMEAANYWAAHLGQAQLFLTRARDSSSCQLLRRPTEWAPTGGEPVRECANEWPIQSCESRIERPPTNCQTPVVRALLWIEVPVTQFFQSP